MRDTDDFAALVARLPDDDRMILQILARYLAYKVTPPWSEVPHE